MGGPLAAVFRVFTVFQFLSEGPALRKGADGPNIVQRFFIRYIHHPICGTVLPWREASEGDFDPFWRVPFCADFQLRFEVDAATIVPPVFELDFDLLFSPRLEDDFSSVYRQIFHLHFGPPFLRPA